MIVGKLGLHWSVANRVPYVQSQCIRKTIFVLATFLIGPDLLNSCRALAQKSADLPEFEAVSITSNKSGEARSGFRPAPGGKLNAVNVTAKFLIEWAYLVRDYQVSGEPKWVDTDRFDVRTTSQSNPPYHILRPVLQSMFQKVLVDRFNLTYHKTSKEMQVYLLSVAKSGPKIQPIDDGPCPEVPTTDHPCRSLRVAKFGQIAGEKAAISALARLLTGVTGKIVLDNTNLEGAYTFTQDWTKYLQPPSGGRGENIPNAFDSESVEPAIATALQEQLGLKLQPGKGPVEVLVIDRIERPTEN